MRFTALILLVASLHVFAKGFAQEKITLAEKDASIQKVIADIQRQTSFDIWYDKSSLPKDVGITINIKNASLEEVLKALCKNQNLEYNIAGNMVVIRSKKKNLITDSAIKIDIDGKVVNEKNEPLSETNISIKNSHEITATNEDGNFSFHGVNPNAILIISRVGYESSEFPLHGNTHPLIKMSLSVDKLDEVQLIGYGSVSRRFNTGDVGTVKSAVIEKQPVSNVMAAIEGRVPGLLITQQTGVPGGGFTVRIFGQNSIASSNNPLYIIDGVPFTSSSITPIGFGSGANATVFELPSPLSSINTSDIESVEILKDADATSIYGSRAANGVILITTKKGKEGATHMNLSAYFGAGKINRTMPLLNTRQYLDMRHEAFRNDGEVPDPNVDVDLLQWDTTRYTDWQKTLLGRSSPTNDVQLSVSGGSKHTQFLVGGGYHLEGTVFPGDFSDKKISGHFNLNHSDVSNKFHLSFTGNYLTENSDLPYTDLTSYALTLPPDAPALWDSTGHLNWENSTWYNPLSYIYQTYNANTNNLIAHANISYQLLKQLEVRVSLGYNSLTLDEFTSIPAKSLRPIDVSSGNQIPNSYFKNASQTTWIIEPQLEYKNKFLKGKIDVLLGGTIQQIINQGRALFATGFSSDDLMEDPQAATSLTVLNEVYSDYKYAGFFGRINYNLFDKYILNLTARRDGSSRFGPGNQFANFGSVGVAWLFASENFLKNKNLFSSGKLKANIGTSGNDQIGDYQYLSTYSPYQYSYQGSSGLYPTQLANPNYQWEKNRKAELGIELGFLKNDLLFSAVYYDSRTSNQLVGYHLPPTTGFSFIEANLPAIVQNTGFEIEINSVNIKSTSVRWITSFNLTIPNNKLLSYPNIEGSTYANLYQVGKSIYTTKLYHYTGVDPTTGIYQFQDVDHDGQISYPNDLQAIKKLGPVLYGGLQNDISFKNWELSFFFQFVEQDGYNYLSYFQYGFSAPGQMGNQPNWVLSRWQKTGDHTNIQQFSQDYGSQAYAAYSNSQFVGDNSVSNASFIRLKNIQISYKLKENILSKLHLHEVNVFLSGQNLLTFTNYLGVDPEVQNISSLPPLRTFTGGIKIIL